MKNKTLIMVLSAALLIIVFILIGMGSENAALDYERAYEKTNGLDSYKLNISTIVTVTEGESTKTSVIDQKVTAFNIGKDGMRYEVVSEADSAESGKAETEREINSYLYYDGNYYYSYPGVYYKSAADSEQAENNIKNLTGVIAFSYEKMYNCEKTVKNGEAVYEYDVEYNDVSNHVKAAVESAVNIFEDGNFRNNGVSASATVKGGYVVKRDMYVEYVSDDGNSVVVEIYTELTDKNATLPVPDVSKFVEIEG